MIVRFTAEAEADLEAIADHIARDDPGRALSFVRELGDKCRDLASAPLRYPLVRRYGDHSIRRRLYGKYLIFYRAGDDEVVILHVLHGARDYAAILFDE